MPMGSTWTRKATCSSPGDTQSTDFPVTAQALQSQNRGGGDAFVALLSADFSRLLYSTYLGGPANDNGRSGFLGRDGSLYVTGSSDGPGWPVRHEYQGIFKGGAGDWGSGDCVLAKLAPASTITVDPGKTYQTITRVGGRRIRAGAHRSGVCELQGHADRSGRQRSRHQPRSPGDPQRRREQRRQLVRLPGRDHRLPDVAQPPVRDDQRQRGPVQHRLVGLPLLRDGQHDRANRQPAAGGDGRPRARD